MIIAFLAAVRGIAHTEHSSTTRAVIAVAARMNPQSGVDGVQLCEPPSNHHNAVVNTMPWASRPCLPQGAADAMAILYTMCTREGDDWSKATITVVHLSISLLVVIILFGFRPEVFSGVDV